MSYPPQQPENGWSDQQQPVDPFAQGNAVPPAAPQADAYGQQPPQQPDGQPPAYQAQPPVYYPEQQPGYPPSDQTQALPPRAPHDAEPTDPFAPAPPYPPVDPNAQPFYQPDPNAQAPVDPNAQQYYQPDQGAPVDPHAQPFYPPADPNTQVQPGYPQAQPGYPQAQPLPDPFAPQQVEQPFPQAPVSASPTSAQPFSGQPFSGQPYTEGTPPGVPESPFASAPSHNAGLPTPVSASPTSGQPWAAAPPMPQFVPRKPRRGLPGWSYVIGVIVIVGALVVGGVVWFGSGDGGNDPTNKASASESEKSEKSEEPKDTVKLITDSKSKLAFASMPDPWQTVDENELPGASSATGQVLESDKGVSGYFAACQLTAKAVKYANGDVVDAGKEWAALIDKSTWVDDDGKKLKGLERRATPKFFQFRVDGHAAYYMTYKVTWKSDKVVEKGAEVTIGVIDQDGKNAAGFLAIMPDSLSEKHKPAVKDTMLTLRFSE